VVVGETLKSQAAALLATGTSVDATMKIDRHRPRTDFTTDDSPETRHRSLILYGFRALRAMA
jgi:hypothetical protein